MRTTIAMLFVFFIAAIVGAPMSTLARLAQLEQQVKVLEMELPLEGSIKLADLGHVKKEESPSGRTAPR